MLFTDPKSTLVQHMEIILVFFLSTTVKTPHRYLFNAALINITLPLIVGKKNGGNNSFSNHTLRAVPQSAAEAC